jgi:hypothetical protein
MRPVVSHAETVGSTRACVCRQAAAAAAAAAAPSNDIWLAHASRPSAAVCRRTSVVAPPERDGGAEGAAKEGAGNLDVVPRVGGKHKRVLRFNLWVTGKRDTAQAGACVRQRAARALRSSSTLRARGRRLCRSRSGAGRRDGGARTKTDASVSVAFHDGVATPVSSSVVPSTPTLAAAAVTRCCTDGQVACGQAARVGQKSAQRPKRPGARSSRQAPRAWARHVRGGAARARRPEPLSPRSRVICVCGVGLR